MTLTKRSQDWLTTRVDSFFPKMAELSGVPATALWEARQGLRELEPVDAAKFEAYVDACYACPLVIPPPKPRAAPKKRAPRPSSRKGTDGDRRSDQMNVSLSTYERARFEAAVEASGLPARADALMAFVDAWHASRK